MNLYERLRFDRGLTQEQVAGGADVARGTIIRLEAARDPRPSHATVRKLADFYGIDAADLLSDREAA